jgi:biotin--protein ligase
LPLRIKWPNDIYYEQKKLGGILVEICSSPILDNTLRVKIGVGFNVNNQEPTDCLNRILRERGLPEWSIEKFLAKCLNNLKPLIEQLEIENGITSVLNDYQENWLHS